MEIKVGCPTTEELLSLAHDIGKKWKFLGRALNIPECELEMLDEDHKKLFDKNYHMLLEWKQSHGTNATYGRLSHGLEHRIVKRKDLSEKFCYRIDAVSSSGI